MNYELGFIGGGNMAEAIVRGAINGGLLSPAQMIVADPVESRRAIFRGLGVNAVEHNHAVVRDARRVVLSVKPQTFATLAADLAKVAGEQLVLSIMAGIPIAKIQAMIGPEARVVRVMPNTPLLIGLGMSAISGGEVATQDDLEFAVKLFATPGSRNQAMVVHESLMDAVTAVSGSGPAYVFYLAEAMTEAAQRLGIDSQAARTMVQQTLLGAATLMQQSAESPAELRRRVTSPGGTTQAALEHMESAQMRPIVVQAIAKAAARSEELGR